MGAREMLDRPCSHRTKTGVKSRLPKKPSFFVPKKMSELQAQTVAKDRLNPKAVTEEETLVFFDALENGATTAEASKLAGFTRQTGHRILLRYEGKLDAVKKLLAAKAMQAAEDWIKASTVASGKGNHVPAKELLQTIRAVEPIESSQGGNVGVTIVIGTPEAPIRISAQIPDLSPAENHTQSETLEIRPKS
jgi:hypothetical protein